MPRAIPLRVSVAVMLAGIFAAHARADMIDLSVQWDGNVAIPDDDMNGAFADIVIPIDEDDPNPLIQDLNVDAIVEHQRQGDLIIRLERVFNGETIVAQDLMVRPGDPMVAGGFTAANIGSPVANPSDKDRFFFDDEAANRYDTPTVSSPGVDDVTGVWQPENPLSIFDNQPKWGTWRLYAIDTESGETGAIRSFSLHLSIVPEPATVGLLALGASFMLLRRRRFAG